MATSSGRGSRAPGPRDDGPELGGYVDARRRRPAWYAPPPALRPRDESEAYRLQHAIHGALDDAGIRRVGYKIGSTSAATQRPLGLDGPVYAGIYDATRAPTLRDALARPLAAPSLECEIALVLRRALDGRDRPDDAAVLTAVGSAHVACEVIDNRYGDPLEFGSPTLLTDDFFHAGFVLGPAQPGWRDIIRRGLAGAAEVGGRVTAGSTADVLRPLEALGWLAERLAAHGRRLEAGEIILTGTLVSPVPVTTPATSASICVDGFGTLTLDAHVTTNENGKR